MFKEKIGSFAKSSNSSAILGESVVRLGGQYRRVSGSINTSISGLGGLDVLDSPTELVKNGTFDTDLSFWTFPAGTTGITWSAGTLSMAVSSARVAEQAVVTIPGVQYTVSMNYNNVTNTTGPSTGCFFAVYTASNATGTVLTPGGFGASGTGTGTLTGTFVATTTLSYIYLSLGDGADAGTFDNVSARSVTPTIAPSTFYYAYAVHNGTTSGLVLSNSVIKPPSYTSYKKIGAFYTDASGNIFKAYSLGDINKIVLSVRASSSCILLSNEDGVVSGDGTLSNTSNCAYNFSSGIFSSVPNFASTSQSAIAEVDRNISIHTVSLTGFQARARNGVNSETATPHSVLMEKTGVDAIQPDWKDY